MKRRKPAIEIVNDNVGEPLTGPHRETLADLVDEYRTNTISRSSFLGRAAVFGLSATSLSGLLAETAGARAAAPRATPKRTAKLNIGVGQDADTVDPQAFKDIPGYYMLANLYDQLVDLKAHETSRGNILIADPSRPVSMIARSMTLSKDLRTVTFKLDPAAKFQDGSPITAADVKYTFSRGILGTQYTNTLMKMLTLTSVKNIRTPNKYTVVFRLDKSNPMTARLLSLQVLSVQSAKVSAQHATAKDKWTNDYWRTHVFGNGPYTLKAWNRGQGFELAPNPKYYKRGLPKNGGLVFKVIADPQQRLNLLKTGALHVAFEITAKDADSIRSGKVANVKLIAVPSPWNFGLTFNNAQKPFTDKRVRQALSYAVPYKAIITTIMRGLAVPANGMVPPGMPTHDGSFWNYNTDLNKAKALLTAAGLGNGFSTSIDVLIGRPEDQQAATLIQANFQQIGVKAQINVLDASAVPGQPEQRQVADADRRVVLLGQRPLLSPVLEHAVHEHVHELVAVLEPGGRQADPQRHLRGERFETSCDEPPGAKDDRGRRSVGMAVRTGLLPAGGEESARLPVLAGPEPAFLLDVPDLR